MIYYLGVDPGKQGGLAVYTNHEVIAVTPMFLAGKNVDAAATANWIQYYLPSNVKAVACIEKVGAMPGQGVVSMFSFGFSTGMMHGVIGALDISLKVVPPQTWKKIVLAGTAKDKLAAIEYCRQSFPSISLLATDRSKKPHSGMADAICLAVYASMTYG